MSSVPDADRLRQSEIMRLVEAGMTPADESLVRHYLEQVADAFSADEAFGVIALVDTPDVFD
jgi:hypothetical protein